MPLVDEIDASVMHGLRCSLVQSINIMATNESHAQFQCIHAYFQDLIDGINFAFMYEDKSYCVSINAVSHNAAFGNGCHQ